MTLMSKAVINRAVPNDHARQVNAFYYIGRIPSQDTALRFLDLGAGDGRSVDHVRARFPDADWIGLDIANSSEVRSRTRDDCKFVTYDGVNIPFPAGRFDVVFSRQVFEHVRHPEPLLREIVRVLRSGGRFIGSVSQLEPFHSASLWNFTYFGFAQIATDAGLELVELRPGIDGMTLTLRNLVLAGLRARSTLFQKYFDEESPGNLAIEALLTPDKMDPANRAEFERLKSFLSSDFPTSGILRAYVPREDPTVADVNLMKLKYAGHFCFEFSNPSPKP